MLNLYSKWKVLSTKEKVLLSISLLILLLSFIPRFYDIHKFLPNYSIDENDIVEFSISYWGGDFDPHWYKYGPLYSYILSFIYFIVSLFYEGDASTFARDIFFDSAKFYYIARLINSCINILLAFFTYKIARKHISSKVALLSLLIAVFPFFDLLTGFTIRIDTLLALWATLLMYNILQIFKTGKRKYYIYAAIFMGLGMATKPLPSILILPTFFLGHFWVSNLKSDNEDLKSLIALLPKQIIHAISNINLYIFIVTTGVANFIFNPYSILNIKTYLNEQKRAILTEGARSFTSGWDVTLLFSSLGFVFVIIGIAAILFTLYFGIKKKNKVLILITSYPIIFWLAFAKGAARDYFYIPIIPCIIIAIAFSCEYLCNNRIKINGLSKFHLKLITVLLLIAIPGGKLIKRSIQYNASVDYHNIHSEIAAKKWIEENINRDDKIILLGSYCSLPRIVSSDKKLYANFVNEKTKRHEFLGQFFMYKRGLNRYYTNLFLLALRDYITDGRPCFSRIQFMSGNDNVNNNEDFLVKAYNGKIKYVISSRDLDQYQYFQEHKIKAFDKERGYPFGTPINIYEISVKNSSDLAQHPVTYQDYYINGFINMQLKNDKEAYADFDKCIKLGDTNPKSYFIRGILNYKNKRYKKAISDFDKAIEINPKYADAYYYKGLCQILIKQQRQAIPNIKKADSLGCKPAQKLLKRILKK